MSGEAVHIIDMEGVSAQWLAYCGAPMDITSYRNFLFPSELTSESAPCQTCVEIRARNIAVERLKQ